MFKIVNVLCDFVKISLVLDGSFSRSLTQRLFDATTYFQCLIVSINVHNSFVIINRPHCVVCTCGPTVLPCDT